MTEDLHFYIDNAPPDEVIAVLSVLSSQPLSPAAISQTLHDEVGFQMQKDVGYSPRRLFDLGLALQTRKGSATLYTVSPRGARLQGLLSLDRAFVADLLHYAHFSGWSGQPSERKFLWSYRRCCERMWSEGCALSPKDLAADVQDGMKSLFPHISDEAKKGGRFEERGAGRVIQWLKALEPSPLEGKALVPRRVGRPELALLALDDLYRTRCYAVGDGVVLDEPLWDKLAGVFFLDRDCVRELLHLAARTGDVVSWRDTLAGPAVVLKRRFTLEDV